MTPQPDPKQAQPIWTPELIDAMAKDLDRGRVILAKTGSWNPSTEKWSKAA